MATQRARGGPNELNSFAPEIVPIEQLHLDARNPRIEELGEDLDEEKILEILWREYSVDEVAMSIAQNGFFPHEPLFVTEENEKLVVVEGNRRLAAVRLLRQPDLRRRLQATNLPDISEKAADDLGSLPVIRCQRETIWQYVGFKHVNGPQPWDSFAKAKYIAWVKNDLGIDLGDVARTIGDTHSTVIRLYRAYMALQQAEHKGGYSPEQRTRRHFSFSHLYTGLDYPGIRRFTRVADLDPPIANPIPKNKLKEFGELCGWLWGDKTTGKVALIKSQNPDLRRLDEALQSKQGLSALRAGYGISVAVDIARGDTALFREALLKAKQSLQEARGKVETGFAGEQDLEKEMSQIIAIAAALNGDMLRIGKDSRTRQREGRRRLAERK